ncbi:MAG: SDR family NAD(P)-dependent oxidoreductase [Planctomycetaceae bacterium]|nr:SDR family NAD(P)-dependent oxidoreductase [Planctomycetaceae bacterium]
MAVTKQNALVTGGGSGIGEAICRELARRDWCVAVTDVNVEAGAQVAAEIQKSGGDAFFLPLNVTSQEEWESVCEQLQAKWPQIDMVVNNAGVCAGGELDAVDVATWDWIYNINLRGAMLGCKTFIPWLKRNPRQSYIMNIASIAGLVFAPRMAPYNATKAALVALSETLKVELLPHKVSVTVVCPWFVPTNLAATGRFAQESEQQYAVSQMKNSWVTPELVARRAVSSTLWRQAICLIGLRARSLMFVYRMCPWLIRWLIGTWTKSIFKESCAEPAIARHAGGAATVDQ